MATHNFSDYTCKSDYDCHDKGYCHLGVCECLPNYGYRVDCSSYGCKCLCNNRKILIGIKQTLTRQHGRN